MTPPPTRGRWWITRLGRQAERRVYFVLGVAAIAVWAVTKLVAAVS